MSKKKTILMAIGSSGGHIYPALAVAKELDTKNIDIYFVHSGSMIGKKIFFNLKYPIYEIPLGGLAQGTNFFYKIKTLFQLPGAFIKSFFLIKKLKIQIVLGTGGSVTGPVVLTGVLMNCKTAIWEGNVVMGLANRMLAPFVSSIFTVFPELTGISKKKQIVSSYPLRKQLERSSKKLLEDESTEEQFFNVLILGGSQGSYLLNQVVSEALQDESWRKDIFIYHQTGESSFLNIKKRYSTLTQVEAFSFSLNIEQYYKKCHLVFSRAGSGAIWEIASFKKPLVLIPLTHSADGHQLKNALALQSKDCVELIQEKDFNKNTFTQMLLQLKQNKEKTKKMARYLSANHRGEGAKQIARWIMN